MRDAPWIEATEKYGCEYVHDFVFGKQNPDGYEVEDEEEEEEEDDE